MKKSVCKLWLLQLSVALLCFLGAQEAYAQSKAIVVNVQNEPLPKVLRMIEKNTNYKFMFTNDDLNRYKVTKNINEKDIHVVVSKLISGLPLKYSVNKNFIYITVDNKSNSNRGARRVTGHVVDENGEPLMGATVQVVGKNNGVIADNAGRFTIDDLSEGDKLQISYLGMKTVTVAAKDGTITMVSDNMIDDVIVTGYGTYKRGEYVGAVTQVKADDIKIAGEATIDQMLQGIIPGMSVVNTTGKVGGTPKIRIRGTSTILGNQEPLWVVDDVIQTNPTPIPNDASPLSSNMEELTETAGNAISWLNPADIETITVLKDASATAIYGSQASNGVIVITTKKAKQGSGLSVNYNGNMTLTERPDYGLYDMMNSQEYMQFQQEMWQDRNQYTNDVLNISYAGLISQLRDKKITRQEFEQEFRKLEMMNTDWFDLLFRTAFSTNHNISLSASSNTVSSRISLGVNNTAGEAKGNDMFNFTASSNTTFRVSKKLIIDLMMNGSFRKTTDFAYGVSPYEYAMNTTRSIAAYNDDGTYFYHDKYGSTSYSYANRYYYNYNILNEIDNTGSKSIGKTFQGALNLKWNILDCLQFQGSGSFSMANSNIKSWATEYSNYIASLRGYEYGEAPVNSREEASSILPYGGLLNMQNNSNINYSFRGALVFNKLFAEKHSVTLNLGAQVTSNKVDGETNLRYGYLKYRGETFATVPSLATLDNVTGYRSLTDLAEMMRAGTNVTNTKSNTLSEYFTAVYSYDNRYVLNMNARMDASNRFGQDENKRFNPSFSLGAKWRIGEEPFMEWARDWYDMFDISFAYGWRGNAVTAVSPYLIAKDGGLHTYYHQYYLSLVSLPYPDLGWEKTKDWNLGVDFSFFNGRLSAGFNMYNKKSNVLASREVSAEYGVDAAYIDGTTMRNQGYELIVSVTPIRTRDWTWSLSFNTSKVKNSVDSKDRVNSLTDYLNGTFIKDGDEYGTFYAFDFAGLDHETGRPTFNKLDITDATDYTDFLVKAGTREPDLFGGMNTSLRYKNFHLRASFAMSFGAKTFLPSYFATSGAPRPEENLPRYMADRWRQPGDEMYTDIPSIPEGRPNNLNVTLPLTINNSYTSSDMQYNIYEAYNNSSVRVAKTDFIRCRSLSLQYNVPNNFAQMLGMRNIYCDLSLTNPFFISFDKKWEGRDPETANWPARRSLTFSLNMSF